MLPPLLLSALSCLAVAAVLLAGDLFAALLTALACLGLAIVVLALLIRKTRQSALTIGEHVLLHETRLTALESRCQALESALRIVDRELTEDERLERANQALEL